METHKPNHRVLLIEDDKTLNRLMLDQVQRLGYDARSATSREETLEVLRDFPPRSGHSGHPPARHRRHDLPARIARILRGDDPDCL
ncbi:hypothetical protein [Profundibacter sp.]